MYQKQIKCNKLLQLGWEPVWHNSWPLIVIGGCVSSSWELGFHCIRYLEQRRAKKSCGEELWHVSSTIQPIPSMMVELLEWSHNHFCVCDTQTLICVCACDSFVCGPRIKFCALAQMWVKTQSLVSEKRSDWLTPWWVTMYIPSRGIVHTNYNVNDK